MLWSVLIAGIPERYSSAQPLLYSLLESQGITRLPDVELLYLLDSKRRTVGAKRNALLDTARGTYISFIDDDDKVSPYYVRRIYRTLKDAQRSNSLPDVVCFRQKAILEPAGVIHDCTYTLARYKSQPPEQRRTLAPTLTQDGAQVANVFGWAGPPAHTMVWRRAVVKDVRFPEENFGEDVAWVDAACDAAQTEVQIEGEPLYIYRFNAERSATR